ncbi:MAG: SDR family oxidoreductase [Rhodospirillaceae bacterium]|jgi:3-oxoacyl-[acyl-carrier protein] reductase|nr:SDR family oxidoreductase [Rhodospirillaceae bacterium]MBT5455276.1 SDR family oxidoreductase [Rhodospirillaceae bacterium]
MTAENGPRELEGTGAIVTGSTGIIGRAIALALAEAGAGIVINGRTSGDVAEEVVAEIEAIGGRAIVHLADVTSEEAVQGMIDAAVDAFGRLDILINNVGPGTSSPITELTYAEWRRIMASKLDSAFLCSKAAIPHLGVHGQGVIINIGASSAHVGNANRSVDGAAKMGLAGLTGSLAIELAPQNITVNCVAPGRIQRPGATSPHFAARPIPAGREGTPEEFAETVRFLCGPHSRFTTGQTLHVNGGWYVSIN